MVAMRSRFTRIPKIHDLISTGIPTEVIPTYCALADYSNNKTGLCWPRMETLARRLSRSPRTIQRHLHLLKEKGLIEFVERKRDNRGRFGAYLYRVVHIVAATARGEQPPPPSTRTRRKRRSTTTGHGGRVAPIKGLTKPNEDTPLPPKKDLKRGYWWFFGEQAPTGLQEEHDNEVRKRREEDSRRRTKGFEWFFE
jgi:DNA-binding transcriptional ArsR family regulator